MITDSTGRTPLARRGLLHGSTHAPDHDELLRLLEEMHTTHVILAVVSLLALAVALTAVLLVTM